MFGLKLRGDEKDQIISTLTKENRRLKIENEALEKSVSRLGEIKKEYEDLMLKVIDLRADYEDRLLKLDELTSEYQKALNKITVKAERNIRK